MKFSFLLILIVSVLLVGGASGNNPSSVQPIAEKEKSLSKEQKASGNQEQGSTQSVPIQNLDKPSAPIRNQKTEDNKESAKQPVPSITDWIMAGVTAAYAVFALLQWRAIRRQANIAESNLRVVERAWLAVLFDQRFQPKAGAHNPIYYSVKNTGHTVAFLKDRKLNVLPWNGFIPKRQLAPKPTGILSTIAAIFPGDKFPLEGLVDIDFTQQMINDAATGRFIFDVYGYVAYDDAFGNRHITRFCQAYNPNGDSGSFTYPREAQLGYNDAD